MAETDRIVESGKRAIVDILNHVIETRKAGPLESMTSPIRWTPYTMSITLGSRIQRMEFETVSLATIRAPTTCRIRPSRYPACFRIPSRMRLLTEASVTCRAMSPVLPQEPVADVTELK